MSLSFNDPSYWQEVLLELERFWRTKSNKLTDAIREVEGESFQLKIGHPDENLVQSTEARIGRRLPPSYRTFLSVADGLRPFCSVQPEIWPCEKIDYFPTASPEWYQDVSEGWPGGPKDLAELLQIAPGGDGYILLLDPNEMHEQEWRAWRLGVQDEQEYQSFGEMFAALCARNKRFGGR